MILLRKSSNCLEANLPVSIISNKFVSLGPEDKARHPQVWYLPRTASGPGQLQAEGKGKGHFDY